jgi:hypothetical protein
LDYANSPACGRGAGGGGGGGGSKGIERLGRRAIFHYALTMIQFVPHTTQISLVGFAKISSLALISIVVLQFALEASCELGAVDYGGRRHSGTIFSRVLVALLSPTQHTHAHAHSRLW